MPAGLSAPDRHAWMELIAHRGAEPLAGVSLVANLNNICADVAELTGAGRRVHRRGGDVRANRGGPVPSMRCASARRSPRPRTGVLSDDEGPASVATATAGLAHRRAARARTVGDGAIVTHQRQARLGDRRSSPGSPASPRSPHWRSPTPNAGKWRRPRVLEDRHRIARDLHDHVIQRLFAIGMSQTLQASSGVPDEDAGSSR